MTGERVGPTLLPVDDADRVPDDEAGGPQRLDGAEQRAAARDDVLDQADALALLERPLDPVPVPYAFASSRTIRKGRPEASEAAAASATAPSSGPASRAASGSCSTTAAAIRSPSGPSSSGLVSKRYLSR